ncbi:MAG: DUF2461 domain-containing protein [Oscillospiraceae bacterium]|nr:DUF2461 domain-containing protein [Oscillospiraceae bacterium]
MFEGYSPETVDFLWGIRMNNNRDWFLAHKKDYVNYLYEPTKALGKDLFAPFLQKTGHVLKVSRIYRDTRLHHPLPYKESLWICIRPDVQWWAENPCLYFEICPEGVTYGFALYRPRPSTMEAFRRHIAAHPRQFTKLVRDTEKATGIPITANLYKRPKECPGKELEPFYAWKDCIFCTVTEEVGPEVFGPELGKRAAVLLQKLTPLYEFFCQFQV